jgi:LysM repeat protein
MENKQPHKKSRRRLWLGLLAVLIILLAALSLFFISRNRTDPQPRTADPRPLVLIHNPRKNAQFEVGEGVLVHTTAQFTGGLSRLELWADDVLVAAVDRPDQPSSNLVLSHVWIPHLPGGHVLVARAIGQNNAQGQAAIQLHVLEPSDIPLAEHTVQEGETLESIAADYGLTSEDLSDLNPGIEAEDLSPGDSLTLPDDEPAGREAAARPEGEGLPLEPEHSAPIPEAEPPAGVSTEREYRYLSYMERLRGDPGELIGVQADLLSLETGAAYEGLYCYIGIGDQPPNRYPDQDGNPATDEWFDMHETTAGGPALWQVEGLLEAGNAPLAFWPQDQAVPFNIACVGIMSGGTESARLGRWEGEIPPERWTGIPLELGASGEDGWFMVTIRFARYNASDRGVPLYLDPDMIAPSNAWLNPDRFSLNWDYIAVFDGPIDEMDEFPPIDGFRIYLNGNLLWVEPPNARESFLPFEWFQPPCDTTYVFSVTAYQVGIPDGPESMPAVTTLEQPLWNCHRQIQITFLSLETFNLDGDGRRPEHHGDVGPVSGFFYANDQQVFFDTRLPGRGGTLDLPSGLNRNSFYDLWALSADSSWRFSGPPSLVVEVPPEGTFEFGFDIVDHDYGPCRRPSDPGCPDIVCFGSSSLQTDATWDLDAHHEYDLVSRNGLCRVSVQFGPAFGSPVGSGVAGEEPLPWIDVEDILFNDSTGTVHVPIRNTGTGGWVRRDLTVEFQTRNGVTLDTFTYPDFTLEAGARTILGFSRDFGHETIDGCILIDPLDQVLELHERSGANHTPVCLALPDLVITDVSYSPTGTGQVRVTVQNQGPGKLAGRTLDFRTVDTVGRSLYVSGSWPDVTLEPYESRVFTLFGANQRIRERMQNGYAVIINEYHTIQETDFTNNIFIVANRWLHLGWCGGSIPNYSSSPHYRSPHVGTARMFFKAEVISGTRSRTVIESAQISEAFVDPTVYHHIFDHNLPPEHSFFTCNRTFEAFNILNDESLSLTLSGDYRKAGRYQRFQPLGTIFVYLPVESFSTFPNVDELASLAEGSCEQYRGWGIPGHFGWHSSVCFAQSTSFGRTD